MIFTVRLHLTGCGKKPLCLSRALFQQYVNTNMNLMSDPLEKTRTIEAVSSQFLFKTNFHRALVENGNIMSSFSVY